MAEQAPKEITGLPYGENQVANEVASMAPLAAAEPPPPMAPPVDIVGLAQGSQRPLEPETAEYTGMDLAFSDEYPPTWEEESPELATMINAFKQEATPELMEMIVRTVAGE